MGPGTLVALTIPGPAVLLVGRRFSEVLREDEADGAPPRSRVDLDARVAHLVLPQR
jgi:hypothetical protein